MKTCLSELVCRYQSKDRAIIITVYSLHSNDPWMLELQYLNFKKLIRGEFRYIPVIDCSPVPTNLNFGKADLTQEFTDKCLQLGLTTAIFIPQSIHRTAGDHSQRVGETLNHLMPLLAEKKEAFALFHSDIFLLAPVDLESEYCAKWALSYVSRYTEAKREYVWDGLILMSAQIAHWAVAMNFLPGKTEDDAFDTGGATYAFLYLLEKAALPRWRLECLARADVPITRFPTDLSVAQRYFFDNDPRCYGSCHYAELYDRRFLHYRAAGNWDDYGEENHRIRKDILAKALAML